jgi:hypothetical protein
LTLFLSAFIFFFVAVKGPNRSRITPGFFRGVECSGFKSRRAATYLWF